MIFKLFARKTGTDAVERLYAEIMAAARQPALFLPPYGVPDTLEGRFDLLVAHAFLVIRRLAGLGDPAPQMAQELSDRLFLGFDRTLREMGVGDLAVPKRIKKLAADYAGRCAAYEAALGQGEAALATALARNVYSSTDAGVASALAPYMLALKAALDRASFVDLESGPAPFPDPAASA